jgi:CheY-like chemotaxis protein
VIEVQDQGHGMSPDVLTQAFDPFFTTKEVGQGTGLGLPVAFGIIHGHQGYLAIESHPGEGTCVRLYLPVLEISQISQPAGERSAILEPEQLPGKRILIVDDEQSVGDVVRRFLEIAGHEVSCATSAAEGFDRLSVNPKPDLILLDLMIPHEDGPTNFRTFRMRYPEIPILLCTGLLQPNVAEALGLGDDVDILRKPFRMNELWYRVNETLDRAGRKQ